MQPDQVKSLVIEGNTLSTWAKFSYSQQFTISTRSIKNIILYIFHSYPLNHLISNEKRKNLWKYNVFSCPFWIVIDQRVVKSVYNITFGNTFLHQEYFLFLCKPLSHLIKGTHESDLTSLDKNLDSTFCIFASKHLLVEKVTLITGHCYVWFPFFILTYNWLFCFVKDKLTALNTNQRERKEKIKPNFWHFEEIEKVYSTFWDSF